MVSVGDELVEAVKWSGRGLAGEWADGRLHETPTLSNMAQTVPVLDDRVMAWQGPDYDPTGDGWTAANIIAVQGWGSTFYTGLPPSGQTLRRCGSVHRPATTTMRRRVGICFVGGCRLVWVVTSSITPGTTL